MLIGYDAKRALANATGLGNYSRFTIGAIAEACPDDELVMYAPAKACRDTRRVSELLARDNVRLASGGGAWWRTYGITDELKADGVDLYHGLSNELPLNIAKAGSASVVTIHDLIWRRWPDNYKKADRMLYDYKYSRAARNATRIVAISECTKRDIISDFGVSPDKIDVIYQGCDATFKPVDETERKRVRAKYGLDRDYIIAVGTVEIRKNQMLAVKALKGLPRDIDLVIVGGQKPSYTRDVMTMADTCGVTERVKWLSGVPFHDLPGLYAGAVFSSYTSCYEGFGLPVIESLSVGVPVIAATGSCLEEAGGDAALYVNPSDVDGYVHAARRMLEDSDLRRTLMSHAPDVLQKFTPRRYATDLIATYRKSIEMLK